MCGLVSTLENACTMFGTLDAVKRAFKRRNILNGREITYSYRQNRRVIAFCVCLSLFRRWRTRALRSACSERCVETSKYLKRERINATLLSESTNDCDLRVCGLVSTLQNSHALRPARIMQWEGRLNDEISQTGEKLRIIVVKTDELLLFSCVWACFDAGKRVNYVRHAWCSGKSV